MRYGKLDTAFEENFISKSVVKYIILWVQVMKSYYYHCQLQMLPIYFFRFHIIKIINLKKIELIEKKWKYKVNNEYFMDFFHLQTNDIWNPLRNEI